jgi:hypothetical protein
MNPKPLRMSTYFKLIRFACIETREKMVDISQKCTIWYMNAHSCAILPGFPVEINTPLLPGFPAKATLQKDT